MKRNVFLLMAIAIISGIISCSKINDIDERLSGIESTSFSLNIVPDYSDGSVNSVSTSADLDNNTFQFYLNVSVTPAKYAQTIADTDEFACKATFVQVTTKADTEMKSFDVIPSSISNHDGRLEVKFELDSSTKTEISEHPYSVSFSVEDKDGCHGVETPYAPIYFKENPVEPNVFLMGYEVLPGEFWISDSKKVRFSQGNLQKTSNYWRFAKLQYELSDLYQNRFCWSTESSEFGTTDNFKSNVFVDWAKVTTDSRWRTLSHTEWDYLLAHCGHRFYVKIENTPNCLVLAPSDYTDGIAGSYNADDWKKAEQNGLVCLPGLNSDVYYWTSSNYPRTEGRAYCLRFNINESVTRLSAEFDRPYNEGHYVRLVMDVE